MKKFLYLIFVLMFISVAESDEESSHIEKYLSGQVDVSAGPNWNHYHILAAHDNTPSKLLAILKNREKKDRWKDAIQALGILASGENKQVPLAWLTDMAEQWESDSIFDNGEQLRHLASAYTAIAYQGSTKALAFLKSRASEKYWENRDMPSSIEVIDHPHSESKVTARSKALLAIAQHPSLEAERFYREAYTDPKFSEDYLQAQIESNFRMRETWLNAHKERIKAYQIKQKGQTTEDRVSENLPVDVPLTPPVPEVKEVAKESTASEPAAEESAEVTNAEPSEEPTDKSSQWWLWLIGVLVIVCGLGLVLRRKS